MTFFVSSTGVSLKGDFGGLTGADKHCDKLAKAAGVTGKKWVAYLSADMGPNGQPVHAHGQQTRRHVVGLTCKSWTSESSADRSQVGHSNLRTAGQNTMSWNLSHVNGGSTCDNLRPGGGIGRVYCFAMP